MLLSVGAAVAMGVPFLRGSARGFVTGCVLLQEPRRRSRTMETGQPARSMEFCAVHSRRTEIVSARPRDP
jgi:hypothetical protein